MLPPVMALFQRKNENPRGIAPRYIADSIADLEGISWGAVDKKRMPEAIAVSMVKPVMGSILSLNRGRPTEKLDQIRPQMSASR